MGSQRAGHDQAQQIDHTRTCTRTHTQQFAIYFSVFLFTRRNIFKCWAIFSAPLLLTCYGLFPHILKCFSLTAVLKGWSADS